MTTASDEGLFAKINTKHGEILLKLEHEKTPLTVANFVGLAEGEIENDDRPEGAPFYDGLTFHRVINDFMIQGGCPDGTGAGDPGYKFPDEIHPSLKHDGPGILSMANSGPNTNGSQFFITHKETPWLDGKHTVFGHVVEGMEVVNMVKQGDVIQSIEIIRKGKEAQRFDAKKVFVETMKEAKEMEAKRQAEMKAAAKASFMADLEPLKEDIAKAKTTESGMMYIIHEEGKGPKATMGQNAKVNYIGKFVDGKLFDTNLEEVAKENNMYNPQRPYAPLDVPVGQGRVIKGWDEGLQLLNEGAKATFYIPYYLAYGERGYPNAIPPKATLIFEVELVSLD